MKLSVDTFDVIIVGAGMGGLTAGSLLAKDGYSVLLLEAAHVAGGCSSSFKRKGYVFESGATTLIGFDSHQPLRKLEELLGVALPKEPISPSMTVHQNGREITRWLDQKKWIAESQKHFGEEIEQKRFWELAFKVSDIVWKVSSTNPFFPPSKFSEYLDLFKNDLKDLWVLPYAMKSVKEVAAVIGISNPDFFQFLDEQLMISAQSVSTDTPFLFGAPAITYTNYTNYYVPGGLIKIAETLENFINRNGSRLHTKEKVVSIEKIDGKFLVNTSKDRVYESSSVISNIPIWNMSEITQGEIKKYFSKESEKYSHAWGAFTMGIVTNDPFPDDMTLHHQIHINEDETTNGLESGSIFVSFSSKDDHERAPAGQRVLNVSAHTNPDYWFSLNGNYNTVKVNTQEKVMKILRDKLPHFSKAAVKLVFSASPVTWNNWVYRKKGRVGGIPQSMMRSLFDWTPAETPFKGLYLCGDTVFPGQGILGVTLSGINVYLRVKKTFNHSKVH